MMPTQKQYMEIVLIPQQIVRFETLEKCLMYSQPSARF